MKIPRGALELVEAALVDLATNRLPLPVSIRLHNATKAVRVAKVDREQLKDTIIKGYLPEELREVPGSGLKPEDPMFPEMLGKLNEFWASEVELEAGPAVDLSRLNGVADKVMCKPESLSLLQEFGLLVLEPTLVPLPAGAPAEPPPPPAELRLEK